MVTKNHSASEDGMDIEATTANHPTLEPTKTPTDQMSNNANNTVSPEKQNASLQITDQTVRLSFPRLLAAYLCLCASYFTSYVDMNSVTTTLPTVSKALHAGSTVTWAGTAYLLGQTTFQPLYGRLSDIIGRKPMLMASLGLIVVGDLLCGFAQTPVWLYVCRALSGIGGGGISSLVSIIVSDLVSLRDRGRYQGLISCAIGTGALAGPFIAAGLLRDGAQAWRWVFWVPAIIASACLVLLLVALPQQRVEGDWREKVAKIDWFGILASVTGVVLLLIPISSGGSIWPWRSASVIAMLMLGGLSLVIFAFVESYAAKLPITPLRLFKQRSLAIMFVQGFLHDFVWQTTSYFIPLYFQEVRGYSPLSSAILSISYIAMQSIAGALSGPILTRLIRYMPVLRTGFVLWTVGAGLVVMFSRTTPTAVCVVALGIEGTGIGFIHQPGLVAVQALANNEDRAVATSTRNLLRSLGAVIGVAVGTAVQYASLESSLQERHLPSSLIADVLDGSWRVGDSSTVKFDDAILDSKMNAFRTVFIILVPLMVVCTIGCLFVQDTVLKGDEPSEETNLGESAEKS